MSLGHIPALAIRHQVCTTLRRLHSYNRWVLNAPKNLPVAQEFPHPVTHLSSPAESSACGSRTVPGQPAGTPTSPAEAAVLSVSLFPPSALFRAYSRRIAAPSLPAAPPDREPSSPGGAYESPRAGAASRQPSEAPSQGEPHARDQRLLPGKPRSAPGTLQTAARGSLTGPAARGTPRPAPEPPFAGSAPAAKRAAGRASGGREDGRAPRGEGSTLPPGPASPPRQAAAAPSGNDRRRDVT